MGEYDVNWDAPPLTAEEFRIEAQRRVTARNEAVDSLEKDISNLHPHAPDFDTDLRIILHQIARLLR